VIRAEEHLSNTPRQIFMIDALGWPRPEYAHLPFVAEPGSQRKLSKRKLRDYLKNPDFRTVHEKAVAIARAIGLETSDDTFNPVIVDFYEQVGYLPDAIVNYLLLLGWSLDDKTEMFTRQEMIQAFSLERVNKSPASFDVKKLTAFQERYMGAVPLDEKVRMTVPYLQKAGLVTDPAPPEALARLRQVLQQAAHRVVVAGDVLDYGYFFAADDKVAYDDKAFDKHVRRSADLLGALARRLAEVEPFDAAALEAAVRGFAEAHGVKLGQANQALRVATTGKDAGFGTYETLAILGKDRCLARVERALGRV